MPIESENPEADEAHDIMMKQRGFSQLLNDAQTEADKLKLFPGMLEALKDSAKLIAINIQLIEGMNKANSKIFGPAGAMFGTDTDKALLASLDRLVNEAERL